MARMYDLRRKEIINTQDGVRYGFVSDLIFDDKEGNITALIVPGPGRVLGVFGRDQEYRIPWANITKIGEDIILVEVDSDKILVESEG